MLVRLQLVVVPVRVLRQFLLNPAYYCIIVYRVNYVYAGTAT